jgi:quercetin dioxygenase-like cupin family protein
MTTKPPPPEQRIFDIEALARFSDERATITEVIVTAHSSLAVWGVRAGQEVPAHTHPDGQDTWIMIRGELTYYLGDGRKKIILAGQCDVAEQDQIHGAKNEGAGDAVFLSVYSAAKLGWVAASP